MRIRLPLAAFLLTGAAFQTQGPMVLGAADPLISHATFHDFFPPEDGLRWSGSRSEVVFKEPGAFIPVRVELLLSGWRPPGEPPAELTLRAGATAVTVQLGPGAQTVSLETITPGIWSSDLVLTLQSSTFDPGPADARKLGVRVEEARLVPLGRGPRVPPLRPLVLGVALAILIVFILGQAGIAGRTAESVALASMVILSALFAWARPVAAVWTGPAVVVLGVVALLARSMPRFTRFVVAVLAASAKALAEGWARLRDVQVVALILFGAVLVVLAYRAPSRIDIDLGSGREVAVAHGLGAFEGKGGPTSRRVLRGASLDLRDFGGGAPWKITAAAALYGAPRDVTVVRAGDREMVMALRETKWTEGASSAPSPFGWRSGLRIEFPEGSDSLRVDRITIERGAARPSLRVMTLLILSALLALLAFGSAGLSKRTGLVAAVLVLVGSTSALVAEPLAAIPFTGHFFGIVLAGAFLGVALKGVVSVLGDGRADGLLPGPVAIGSAMSGFAAWLTATAFPYYRGGHFVFHSSIAEEIWKGRFLIYYLPYPGSMLSEQAQWGKIVMPHPALYQTLVSPLAALPRAWFYFSEKVLLAMLFASLVLVAWFVAARVFSPRAAAFTAVLFVGLVPGFQLLGLGHLMTILGVWTSSLVLAWLMFKVDDLSRFRVWSATVALFTFCFLSYTAALLFTGAVLVFVILVSARTHGPRARAIFSMLVAACAFAFVLYYIHWTVPFLLQSVPKIMGGAGLGGAARETTPVLARLLLEPSKLSYSYGSMWIPLAGAVSLWFLPRSWPRLMLLSWVGILFFVSGMDLFFNFLLKHHYYVMVPVAVGLGGLMARVEAKWGPIPSTVLTILILGLGLNTAIEVALGLIP